MSKSTRRSYLKPVFLTFCVLNIKLVFVSMFFTALFSSNSGVINDDLEFSLASGSHNSFVANKHIVQEKEVKQISQIELNSESRSAI